MILSLENGIREISLDELDKSKKFVGYIDTEDIRKFGADFGLVPSVIEACSKEIPLFRTDVEVHHDFTFTQMRIINEGADDDCIALLGKSNFILVVNISDSDRSTENKLLSAVNRIPADRISIIRVLCSFIESLISGGNQNIEMIRNEITDMEETVITGNVGPEFNRSLLEMKKKLLKLHNYYEQILDIAEAIEENENDLFEESQLIYASNLTNKVTRLIENADSLRNSSDHLQDAYSSALEMKLNHTMKIFTVITTVFFPLTIIVGWYGMNFSSMPEFAWKYGYIYVILLSVITVCGLVLLGRKKKWF